MPSRGDRASPLPHLQIYPGPQHPHCRLLRVTHTKMPRDIITHQHLSQAIGSSHACTCRSTTCNTDLQPLPTGRRCTGSPPQQCTLAHHTVVWPMVLRHIHALHPHTNIYILETSFTLHVQTHQLSQRRLPRGYTASMTAKKTII